MLTNGKTEGVAPAQADAPARTAEPAVAVAVPIPAGTPDWKKDLIELDAEMAQPPADEPEPVKADEKPEGKSAAPAAEGEGKPPEPAPEGEIPEIVEHEIDEDAIIRRALERENDQLKSLKGKQGNEIGELRELVSNLVTLTQKQQDQLQKVLEGRGSAKDEDAVTKLLEDPESFVNERAEAKFNEYLKRYNDEAETSKVAERAKIEERVPYAAWDLFTAKYGIADPEKFAESEAGKALLEGIRTNEDAQTLLNAYGKALNAKGFARVLGDVYKRHMNGKRGAAVQKEAKRIEAGKTGALPRATAPAARPLQTQSTWKDDLAQLRSEGY